MEQYKNNTISQEKAEKNSSKSRKLTNGLEAIQNTVLGAQIKH